ncbi:MAG: T9SS type A sorting domain-containing protein [Prolixibacteraceae bacterium]|nr:T9SS type A sorting domain-containing protein [Prolixibacteraceae bacterium]
MLRLYIYISDVSKFDGGGQLEIGSGGKADSYEYSWSVADLNLVDGWNELHLPIASASAIDTPDLSAINWFRLYQFVSEPVETRIDFIRFTELATIPVGVPANLSATAGSDIISLDWDDNTESTFAGYNLYRSETSGTGFTKINSDLIEVSEYDDIDVVTGTGYFYKVSAVDKLGYESAMTEEISALPQDTVKPAAPTSLVAVPGDEQVTLDWDDNTEDDLAGYEVYRSSTSGTEYWNVRTVTESTYTDKYLTNGKTYYYIIKAVDESQNESAASNEVEAIPGAVNVEQLKQIKGFKLYPNPASEKVTAEITLKKLSSVSVSIFDMAGRKIHSFITNEQWVAGEHTLYIPLNNFNKGMYILQCKVNGQPKSKLLKIE